MLAVLRILFGFALFVVLGKAVEVAGPTPQTEGTTDAGYLAVAVFIGIANAVVWAPWVGRWMADPLTGAFTAGHPGDFTNSTLQLAHKLALRRWRRLALFFAFLDGVRHPDLPGAFVLGLNQARPGSWLEKVFAKEVWRFENAENCLRAWKVLQGRGIEPDFHPKPEVNLLLLSQRREVLPTPEVLPVPSAPPAPRPARNPRIRIFGASSSDAVPLTEGAVAGPATPAELANPEASRANEMAGTVEVAPTASTGMEGGGIQEPASKVEEPGGALGGRGLRRKLAWSERIRVLVTGRLKD